MSKRAKGSCGCHHDGGVGRRRVQGCHQRFSEEVTPSTNCRSAFVTTQNFILANFVCMELFHNHQMGIGSPGGLRNETLIVINFATHEITK